jgi:hypothetical protein
MKISRLGILAVLFPVCLAAQTAVEYTLGTAMGTAAGASTQKVGSGIAATFENVGRVLQQAGKPQTAESQVRSVPGVQERSSTVKLAPNDPAPGPKVTYEDIAGIKEGMEDAEVTRRFGPPALKLTTGPGEETLCYTEKDRSLDAKIRNGKVTAVKKTGDFGNGAPKERTPALSQAASAVVAVPASNSVPTSGSQSQPK